MLSKRITSVLVVAALAATLTLGVLVLPAQAATRHINGTVLSKNAGNKTFRITTQSGSHIRIRVNSSTRFQRIAGGFGGLHKGLRIEVEAKTTSNGLLATHVETRQGGGGNGGGGGADDNGGGGGGGADDGPNHT
jgi:Domain of unknown function (DUF5666)